MITSAEKYVNPFTDFGFKKIFGTMEIAKFSKDESVEYEDSLKRYRDMYNVIDTAKKEGWEQGKEIGRKEGKEEGKIITLEATILRCEKKGMSADDIADITGLPEDEIKRIITKTI